MPERIIKAYEKLYAARKGSTFRVHAQDCPVSIPKDSQGSLSFSHAIESIEKDDALMAMSLGKLIVDTISGSSYSLEIQYEIITKKKTLYFKVNKLGPEFLDKVMELVSRFEASVKNMEHQIMAGDEYEAALSRGECLKFVYSEKGLSATALAEAFEAIPDKGRIERRGDLVLFSCAEYQKALREHELIPTFKK